MCVVPQYKRALVVYLCAIWHVWLYLCAREFLGITSLPLSITCGVSTCRGECGYSCATEYTWCTYVPWSLYDVSTEVIIVVYVCDRGYVSASTCGVSTLVLGRMGLALLCQSVCVVSRMPR